MRGEGVSHGFSGSDELRLPYNTRRAKSIATYRAMYRAKTFGAMAIYGFFRENPPNLKIWRNNSASAIVRNLPKSSAIQTIVTNCNPAKTDIPLKVHRKGGETRFLGKSCGGHIH